MCDEGVYGTENHEVNARCRTWSTGARLLRLECISIGKTGIIARWNPRSCFRKHAVVTLIVQRTRILRCDLAKALAII
jgi:hypothetical protein